MRAFEQALLEEARPQQIRKVADGQVGLTGFERIARSLPGQTEAPDVDMRSLA